MVLNLIHPTITNTCVMYIMKADKSHSVVIKNEVCEVKQTWLEF